MKCLRKIGKKNIWDLRDDMLLRKVSMTPVRIRETASRTSPIIQDLRESEFRVQKNQQIYIYNYIYIYTFSQYTHTHSVPKKNRTKQLNPPSPVPSAAIAPPAGTIAVLVPPALVTRRCEDS